MKVRLGRPALQAIRILHRQVRQGLLVPRDFAVLQARRALRALEVLQAQRALKDLQE